MQDLSAIIRGRMKASGSGPFSCQEALSQKPNCSSSMLQPIRYQNCLIGSIHQRNLPAWSQADVCFVSMSPPCPLN